MNAWVRMPRKLPHTSTSRSTRRPPRLGTSFDPPRIELSRLTVRQYRNAVTDLIGSFRTSGRWDEQRGLRAEYSSRTRRRRNGNGTDGSLNRIDPEIHFDFGNEQPDPRTKGTQGVAKSWQQMPVSLGSPGSVPPVLARVPGQLAGLGARSGDRRVRIRDQDRKCHAAFGQRQRSASDRCSGQVGQRHRYRGSVYLLGGRVYPIRLEFIRSKEHHRSIALEWKLPRRALRGDSATEPLAELVPETFVLQTPFPPDDRSVGYERGTSISKAWDQATTDAAIEVAGYVVAHLKELAGRQ